MTHLHHDRVKGVNALIFIRVVVVTLLLDSLYIFNIGYDKASGPAGLSYVIAFIYFLTILYAVALRWIRTDRQVTIFAYLQILTDVLTETVLIYLTGGIASMFSFFFPLSILSAGIILNRRACYIVATACSVLYGALIDLQFYSIIPVPVSLVYTDNDFFYNIFAYITAFYLVGYLSGYLSDKLHKARKSLEERDTVVSDLKAFSEYVIESMPSGIFTTGLNGRIVSFNSAAQEITQLSLNDVLDRMPEEIFPFLGTEQDTPDRIEGEACRGDTPYPVGMRVSNLRDRSGNHIGMIGVFQDLSELKEMEAEVKRKEKWAYIGELSASIAHELRNPLASLKGSVEILREKKVSEEQADHLMKIALAEMDRLNGIITDFLLYARPRQMQKQDFDLHRTLDDVLLLLQRAETGKEGVTISADLDDSLHVSGDSQQMQQVFWNLGVNALDAVHEGGSVAVSARRHDSTVEIVFSDNGRGIDKQELEKIFFPFFTTKDKGTGLGLSIAQKITEDHGGQISAASEGDGRGTTFLVTLPATEG